MKQEKLLPQTSTLPECPSKLGFISNPDNVPKRFIGGVWSWYQVGTNFSKNILFRGWVCFRNTRNLRLRKLGYSIIPVTLRGKEFPIINLNSSSELTTPPRALQSSQPCPGSSRRVRLKFSSQNITVIPNGMKIPLKKTDSDEEKLRQDETTSSNFRCQISGCP